MGRAGATIVLERDLGVLRVCSGKERGPQTQLGERRTRESEQRSRKRIYMVIWREGVW